MADSTLRHLLFWLPFLCEVGDLVSDWLFYWDVKYLEAGLVYGPHEDNIVRSILAFAIIGSVLFLLEAANSWCDYCCDSACLDPYHVSAVTAWIEDVPQTILNILVAVCREEGSSKIQLVKAGVAFVMTLVQAICTFLGLFCVEKNKTKKKKVVTAAIILATIVNALGLISVFILTQTHRQPDGSLRLPEPSTDFEERYDDRFFDHVSVYYFDPTFQLSHGNGQLNEALWMKVVPINGLHNPQGHQKNVVFQYRYKDSPTELRMALTRSDLESGLQTRECYTLHKGSGSIAAASSCTASFLPPDSQGVLVQLRFKPPEMVDRIFRKSIYGDIEFNAKRTDGARCRPLYPFSNTLPRDRGHPSPALHYFRFSGESGSSRHLAGDTAAPRFFKMADLTDVATVWRTGWTKCLATGHLSPQRNDSLQVLCRRV